MTKENDQSLFRFNDRNYPNYQATFINNLLEQYKLCVLAADNVSARRETSNRYLITLNTAIIALYGLLSATSTNPYLLSILALLGVVASILSLAIIKSHKRLNEAKWDVIIELEKHMPAAAFKHEWKLLTGEGGERRYRIVSNLEGTIYWTFMAMHILIPMTIGLILPILGFAEWPKLTGNR